MTRVTWAWPLSILSSAIIAALVIFVFPGIALRPVIIMGFLFVCPGAVLTRFLQIKEPAVEWMLTLALSLALDAIVAGLQLYARIWSPTGTISILIGLCFVGTLVQIALLFSHERSLSRGIRDAFSPEKSSSSKRRIFS
jgi:hypothetical protein